MRPASPSTGSMANVWHAPTGEASHRRPVLVHYAATAAPGTPMDTRNAQGRAKTISALPLEAPYSSGANPFIQPPQPVGTAIYCLPPTL